jgi:curved DNA-binding protein CbpA
MQDHYEVLQIHPKADQESIQAAYERLRSRYEADRLEGAADELVEMARQKRDAIEQAYAVLRDPQRRAAYDAQLAAQQAASKAAPEARSTDPGLDYSPLPPAGGQERPRDFDAQRHASTQQTVAASGGRRTGKPSRPARPLPVWLVPAATVAVITFVVLLTSLLLTDGGLPRYANDTSGVPSLPEQQAAAVEETDAVDPDVASIIAEYDDQVDAARQVTTQVQGNPQAWTNLGDALYDSIQVVRELDPERYEARLPRWLEASEAYATALELDPDNTRVRADMGVSLCYYGAGVGDQSYVEQGLRATQQALEADDQNGRVLLNHGICLVSTQPPQNAEAVALWQQVLTLPSAEMGVTAQARQLVEEYSQ